MITRIRRALTRRSDEGFALPTVIGLGLVLLLLAATAAATTSSIQRKTQVDSDWTSAYYAATAGLSDYQSRLSSIANYNLYGNPSAVFSAGSAPLTLPPSSDPLYNVAFSLTPGPPPTDWAQVPCRTSTCSASTRPAYFRYEVNTKDFSTRGIIHVRSTGVVGKQTRSVIADFRRNGLFNFVYYTNYEIQDPTISGDPAACASYWWSSPARSSSCSVVQFGPYDTLNGDIFSNDQFYICGATFTGRVQSAAPTSPTNYAPWTDNPPGGAVCGGGAGSPSFNPLYPPQNTASISLPPSNATLSTEARADTYTGASAGCMYTGPTSFTLNSSGTMTVVSPLTKVTQPSYTGGIPSQSPAACGVPGTASGQLGSLGGATITVPADNMIYVQSVPATTTDPNYTNVTSTTSWSSATTNGMTYSCWGQAGRTSSGTSQTISGWKLSRSAGAGGGSIQYPAAAETLVPTPTGSAAYQCTAGDAYVSGTLKGHVTIATDRNIYVTDDIDYNTSSFPTGSSYNLLGLVANVALVVWNPQAYASAGSSTNVLTDTNRDLTAAALAVKGTVMVQNYNMGTPRGILNLTGSIEQNFRGTVATGYGSTIYTGYKKNYVYDTNLRYNAPPKYLAPQNATFAVSQIASVPAGFGADGVNH